MAPWLWHPIFVHFTVGLLFTASLLFIVSACSHGKSWVPSCLNAAKWMFWLQGQTDHIAMHKKSALKKI